ncbi:MAG TPA: acyltransferase, partial [Polyangiales bacterium]
MRDAAPVDQFSHDVQRMPALDGLRGLAALSVVLYHFALVTGLGELVGPGRFVGRVLASGWVGVDLFFVLSGYLITDHLLDRRDEPLYYSAFFARRLLRVVPLYVVFVGAYLGLLPLLTRALGAQRMLPTGIEHARAHALWLVSYTANLWMAVTGQRIGAALEPVWSLCVEIHYYLLWPALVRRLATSQLVRVALAGLCFGWLLRVGLFAAGSSAQAIYFATPTRLDAVFVGTLLAAAQREPATSAWLVRWGSRIGVLATLVLVVSWLAHRGFEPQQASTVVLGYSAVALTAGALLH